MRNTLGRAADEEAHLDQEIAGITLDKTFSDYAREEARPAQNARFLSDWLTDLEEVGARIDGDPECGTYASEVNFTLTLRQAFQLGYDDLDVYDRLVSENEALHTAARFLRGTARHDPELAERICDRLEELSQAYLADCEAKGIPSVLASRA